MAISDYIIFAKLIGRFTLIISGITGKLLKQDLSIKVSRPFRYKQIVFFES